MPVHFSFLQRYWLSILLFVIGGLSFVSLTTGPVETSYLETLKFFLEKLSFGYWDLSSEPLIETVILTLRLPRVLTALLVGGGLGAAGACLQGLFRNPLADPGLIGVSSGGAIGAMIAIFMGPYLAFLPSILLDLNLPILAMLGAVATTLIVYKTARIAGKTHVSTLLLAGIAINALSGAIVGALLYFSNNDAIRRFTFWTLGSLAESSWHSFTIIAAFILIPLLILPRYRRALNAFLLGEAEAWHLGFDTQKIKRQIILLCAATVGATVAFCGLIGFIGLVVPHLIRLVLGPDYRKLLPASILLGAALLLAADLAARTMNSPGEIPIGILTSLIGAPFFLYLIISRKKNLAW